MPEGGRNSERGGRFFDQARPDAALAALGAEQHGVVHLDQLADLGLTARAVQKRAHGGRLHRIHQGVYSLVPRELLKREGLWIAAVLACGPGALLSHRSAAALQELMPSGGVKIDVTVPRRAARAHDGIKVHRSTTLSDTDDTVVNKIPCTTVARTLFDIAEVIDQRRLERAFDQAEISEVLDLRAIEDQLARNPTRTGAKAVRKVLSEHYIGKTPTWNENEEALLAITRPLGIPDPDVNKFVVLPDGGPALRVDFTWPDWRVAIEADSGKWHLTRQRFESDRERDQRLIAAGWRVIRTTWRQMKYRPDRLRPILIKLLLPAPESRGAPG
jgi:hypothetical protein